MLSASKTEFGFLRTFFWPIYRHELKKFVPLMLMLILVCFNYSILRNMKDAVVITASGAEVIPFIKVWLIVPMAFAMTFIFAFLSRALSQERVFYIMLSGFLFSFALFTFVLYPYREFLHPTASADFLCEILPAGCKGLVDMYRNWTFTGFYVMCELWGSVILSVITYGFVNEVTKVSEARRFYGVTSIWSNVAAIMAGLVANFLSQGNDYNPRLPFGQDGWEQTMVILVSLVIVCGILTILTFRWMSRNVLTDSSFDAFHESKRKIQKKGKLSMRDSFSFLSNSKYLVCIAVLVVGYNLVINLVEVIWKDQLRALYPLPSDYNAYMNTLTTMTGIVATLLAFSIVFIIDRFGWTKVSLITPVMMGLTSASFFVFFFFQDSFLSHGMAALTGMSPLMIIVFFGALQNCTSKATKYSVFDATKEMAFIPLDHEVKLQGKAAIDGVGSRIGKSGGSIVHQGLLLLFGSISRTAPYVATILFGAVAFWIYATQSLGRQFNALIAAKGEEPLDKEEASEEQVKPVTA